MPRTKTRVKTQAKTKTAPVLVPTLVPLAVPSMEINYRIGTQEEPGYAKLESWEDLEKVESSTVSNIMLAWYFQRLDQKQRFACVDEIWRVLKPGGRLMIVVPYWSSRRAIADPLAQWPPLCEESFLVYSEKWRQENELTALPVNCNFYSVTQNGDLFIMAGHIADPAVATRNDEFRGFASKHYINSVWEMHVTLVKPPGE